MFKFDINDEVIYNTHGYGKVVKRSIQYSLNYYEIKMIKPKSSRFWGASEGLLTLKSEFLNKYGPGTYEEIIERWQNKHKSREEAFKYVKEGYVFIGEGI